MPAFDLRTMVEQLGREFGRRGMPEHLEALRDFYRRELLHREPSAAWSVDVVLEWCARLQVGAVGNAYLVARQVQRRCPLCGWRQDAKEAFLVETSWEGGAKMHCTKCGGRWVQLDR